MKSLYIVLIIILNSFLLSSQVNLTQGLVGHWPFNGNANDISGNNNNGTVNGATLTTGKNGTTNSAYYFNGVSNFIQIASSTSLNFPNNEFTLYALVKVKGFYTGPCHGNCILDKGDDDFIPGHYSLRFDDAFASNLTHCTNPVNTAIQNYYTITYNQNINSGTSFLPYIDTAQWDCIVATHSNNDTKIYINGSLQQTISVIGTIGTNLNSLFFGKKNHPNYPYWFTGIIDEIRIYNRAINTQEIDSLCNLNNPIVIADSIISNFSFSYPNNCDSSAIQFTDLSNATNSTITNWEWYFGDGNSSNVQNPLHTYTGGGPFQVSLIVTSNTNKKDTFYMSVLSIENTPTVTASTTNSSVCFGSPITLSGSGAQSYSWSGGVTNNVSFIPNTTTTYTVTGTDANGCSATSTITISVGGSLPININNSAPLLCLNDVSTLTASGANFYTWTPTFGLNTSNSATVLANPYSSTTYTVVGTDASGCTGSATTLVDIIQPINISVSKSNDIECGKSSAQLLATGATNYFWTPSALVSNPYSNITTTTINKTTTFYVTGTSGTCTDTDSITVEFYNSDGGNTFIPTAFSPNEDGKNDCLHIKSNANFLEFYFAIYNRWGQRVFESDNINNCWNGIYNGKDAPSETYYYYLKAKTSCGNILKKGDMILIR